MASNLTFAVVIPTFNSALFVEKAINSCLTQTLLPKEILIIDDYSCDNTLEIINNINSNLVKVFVNEENKGPSFSRNKGIENCTSDWILFLDSDDIFHNNKIEVLNNILINNPEIRAFGHSCVIGQSQEALNKLRFTQSKIKEVTSFRLLLNNLFVTPSIAVSSNNGILFCEKMKYAEDHDFILRTSYHHKFFMTDAALCSINRKPLSEGGLSSNYNKMRIGEIRMYLSFCMRNNIVLVFPLLAIYSICKHLLFLIRIKLFYY